MRCTSRWLELLKQIAPGTTRVAVLRDPGSPSGVGLFAVLQSVAASLGVELRPMNVRDAGEIERAITAFARSSNDGLIVTGGLAAARRNLIIALAARHRLPAVYFERLFVDAGGLISYGPYASTGKRPATSTAYSKVRNQPICLCKCPRDSSL